MADLDKSLKDAEPHITVIVCTYNRCESLRDTLRALNGQVVNPNTKWELIVVDNNSKDGTKRVCAEAAEDFVTDLRYVFEGTQGLSAARNRGVSEARGKCILFTDDDVLPKSDWVQVMFDAFEVTGAECLSGKILPLWESAPPEWLQDNAMLYGDLAMLDRGDNRLEMQGKFDPNFIYGANMAFKTETARAFKGFDVSLGVNGNVLLRGEETEYVERLFQAGKKIVYVPESIVMHKVGPDRMKLAYFRNIRYRYGRSLVRMAPDRYKGFPFWMIKECMGHGLKSLFLRLSSYQKAVMEEVLFWYQCGQIVEFLNRKKPDVQQTEKAAAEKEKPAS